MRVTSLLSLALAAIITRLDAGKRAEHAASKVRRTLCDRFKGDEETDLKQTTNAIFPTT